MGDLFLWHLEGYVRIRFVCNDIMYLGYRQVFFARIIRSDVDLSIGSTRLNDIVGKKKPRRIFLPGLIPVVAYGCCSAKTVCYPNENSTR